MFDAEDRLILANSRFREIYDHPLSLVRPGTPFQSIIAATGGAEVKSRGSLETGIERPLHNHATDRIIVREWQLEDGRQIEITVARIADGSCVALHEDVTEQRRDLARIVYLSRHDPLTGLLNRDRFFAELERELATPEKGSVTVYRP
jgi:predicted signal transduction protein with EAL and GGDEF domain